jgi:hypothetical protein
MPTVNKFGVYDGYPVRFSEHGEVLLVCFDGKTWRTPSRKVQVYCFECGVLTEQEFRRIFGDDLPPLPIAT